MKNESGGNEKSPWKQCSRGKMNATNFNDCAGKIIVITNFRDHLKQQMIQYTHDYTHKHV